MSVNTIHDGRPLQQGAILTVSLKNVSHCDPALDVEINGEMVRLGGIPTKAEFDAGIRDTNAAAHASS